MDSSKIICDNDFICSFLWAHREDLLITLFKDRLYVPDAVIEEIESLNTGGVGQFVYNGFYNLLNTNKIKALSINFGSEEEILMNKIKQEFYNTFNKVIGEGELQMLALAISQKATCIINTGSNNLKDIFSFIEKGDINNITTMDVFCFAYDKKIETFETLEKIKNDMIKRRRWLPSISVQEYYNSIYKKTKKL